MLTWLTNAPSDKINDRVKYYQSLNPAAVIKVGYPVKSDTFTAHELNNMGFKGIYKEVLETMKLEYQRAFKCDGGV